MSDALTAPPSQTIARVVESILQLGSTQPIRVAVDGRTASGKTTFADELAVALQKAGRPVIRASVDGFHQPASVRHRQGRRSPDGYYEDGRDLGAVRRLLLDPLSPEGSRMYVTESFDLRRDVAVEPAFRKVPHDAVLVMDGTFLQRPELRSGFDFVIFLDVDESEATKRGTDRDAHLYGGRGAAAELYRDRYSPAFARYERECQPVQRADLVIDNSILGSPVIR